VRRDNEFSDKSKPILVIHTGPHKTGTSYLQSILASPSSRKALAKDNYLYLGTCVPGVEYEKIVDNTDPCMPHYTPYSDIPFFGLNSTNSIDFKLLAPEFEFMLQKMKRERKNGLIVFEATAKFIKQLLPFLSDFDVRAAFTYRRIFDWMPSNYGQVIFGNFERRYRNRCDFVAPPPFELFPFLKRRDMGSVGIDEFKCRNYLLKVWNIHSHDGKHRLRVWREYMSVDGLNTTGPIMDFHAKHDNFTGNDLLIELFCSGAVPGTKYSCAAAKRDEIKGKAIYNTRHRVDYAIILLKAYAKGLISAEPSKEMLLDMPNMMKGVNETSLHKKCMRTSKLNKLRELSWENELVIFPDRKGQENVHNKAFRDAKNKGKFSSIDADKLLNKTKWQDKIASWFG